MDKQQITEEYNRIKEVLEHIPAEKKTVVDGLIRQAAFMRISLEELSQEIIESGTVEKYQHGANQSGNKASAALQAYNSTIKNYNAVVKQLVDLLPDHSEHKEAKNSLMELLAESRKGK